MDRRLVARVQMKAGRHNHQVAQLLQAYQYALNAGDRALIKEYEKRLRWFLVHGEINGNYNEQTSVSKAD